MKKSLQRRLSEIQSEEHIVHTGLRDALFDSVGPLFDEPDRKSFPLRPSACLKPMRDLFYDLKNFYAPGTIPKADFDARVKLIFQFGHMTETLMKKVCAHNFSVQYDQERVKYGELVDAQGNKIELSGAIDWAMELDGKLYLCDSKSIGDFPFKKAPKEEHIAQLQLYMHSDWGRANSVNAAILLYFNKNTSDIKCIQFDYDAELAQNIVDRFKKVWEYYLRDEVPPREYLAGCDWQADYSSYKDYDNIEFVEGGERRTISANEFSPSVGKYDKAAVRGFVEKYGNTKVAYKDASVCVVYRDGRLELAVEPE